MRNWAAVSLAVTFSACLAPAKPMIDFPTPNRALLIGKPELFYMYVNRDFEGKRTTPWEGGQFGYVRGPGRVGGEIVYRQLHEGIDIQPVRRDGSEEPLDPVQACADGTVVYVSDDPRASNYGKYLVVEHLISGSPFYSLYAHLSEIDVKPGLPVTQGQRLGRMGYTGAGIDRERAHLHFEFCMMLNRDFARYHDKLSPGDPNRHGPFNGRNLVGMDPSRLLIAAARDPNFNLIDFIRSEEVCFKIQIPNTEAIDLLKMYPWLAGQAAATNPPAWTFSFSQFGVPLRAEPLQTALAEPRASWIVPSRFANTHISRGLIGGTAQNPILTASGKRFVALLLFPR